MGYEESSAAPPGLVDSGTEVSAELRTEGRSEVGAEGDDAVLAALFHRRYSTMVRLAAWLTGDPTAAEDLVQDAFVRVAARDLSAVSSLDAYLRTTVVNLTRTRGRRIGLADRHRIVELPVIPGPETLLADEELAAAVRRLPRRQRECVALRYTEDLPLADIATTLGVTVGSVKKHLNRALTTLERWLEATS